MSKIPESEIGFEIVGPFQGSRKVVVNGYTIPLIDAREMDGGTVSIILDNRLGYIIPAGEAENVLRLVADVFAVAWGYRTHPTPNREDFFADTDRAWARVPHPSLAPERLIRIESSETEEAEANDDPRNAPGETA